jgi:hypothetical protein
VKPTTKEAIETLCNELREDEDYYYSWQANIAMAFKDEMERGGYEVDEQVHEIANDAAKNFLNLLIR